MSDPGEPLARQPARHRRPRPDLRRCSSRVSSLVLAVFLVLSVASSIVRFRRSRGDERQQLKWMTYGVAVVARLDRRSRCSSPGDLGDVLFALGDRGAAGRDGVAMSKYRLYEIDRVISRTLVYGALT